MIKDYIQTDLAVNEYVTISNKYNEKIIEEFEKLEYEVIGARKNVMHLKYKDKYIYIESRPIIGVNTIKVQIFDELYMINEEIQIDVSNFYGHMITRILYIEIDKNKNQLNYYVYMKDNEKIKNSKKITFEEINKLVEEYKANHVQKNRIRYREVNNKNMYSTSVDEEQWFNDNYEEIMLNMSMTDLYQYIEPKVKDNKKIENENLDLDSIKNKIKILSFNQ